MLIFWILLYWFNINIKNNVKIPVSALNSLHRDFNIITQAVCCVKINYFSALRNKHHTEYFKQIDKLPYLFYELGSTKELLSQVRIRDLDYSIYMATGRVNCSMLRYDSMLRYSSSLAETEDFKLAKEIVLELIESLDIQSEECKVILGGAYAVLSYLIAEENDEIQAQYYYLKAIELLSLYPNELLFARYKRAHSFARKKQFEKSFEILTKEGLSDIISKDEVSEIINTWRDKYI